jgi:hypothetical protein
VPGGAAGSTGPLADVAGCSSGGSGVIFPVRTPPGSHRPRVAHGGRSQVLVPFNALREPSYGLRLDRFRARWLRPRRTRT